MGTKTIWDGKDLPPIGCQVLINLSSVGMRPYEVTGYEVRRSVNEVQYHAELDAMTPEQRAEHDAGIAEFKAMLGQPVITDNVGLITDKQPAPVMVAECEICGKGCTNANHPMKAVAVEP
ncbi:hypothetical protein ABZM66_004799, partial [Citrobacter freundii]